MTLHTISLPGRFDGYFGGSGPAQGQTGDDPDVIELAEAWHAATLAKRGRGYTRTMTMSTGAWNALAEWASVGAMLDEGPNEPEVLRDAAASRDVLRRIRDGLGDEFVLPRYCPAL